MVKGNLFYVDIKLAFIVNLDPDDVVVFLQISMTVLIFNENIATDFEKKKLLIRNNLIAR